MSLLVIRGRQRSSEVIRGHHCHSSLGTCEASTSISTSNQWQSVAISGNQWQSVAISGNQWQSVAISGTCEASNSVSNPTAGVATAS